MDAAESRRFRQAVLDWFDRHGRHDLPWQHPATPYRVWVSEVMLQQTQVSVVIPYFQRFVERFPDVVALAAAEPDDVLAHWSGLGYYARARNLHRAARLIVERHGGHMPQRREDWEALPGIGRSTAGAILSLAFGQRQAILDGNVKRVLARYALVDGDPGRAAVQRRLWQLAERLTPAQRCGDYNQAIMDLGATLCTRTKPACPECPLRQGCRALAQGKPTSYPAPRERKTLPERQTRMLLLESPQGLLLERRPPQGVWGGLWSLPECAHAVDIAAHCRERLGLAIAEPAYWAPVRHTFTHYHLHIQPVHARVSAEAGRVMDRDDLLWYNSGASLGKGIAAPVRRLLERWQAQRQ